MTEMFGKDRERQPSDSARVQISRVVFDGLEIIRQSGATNMLDRPTVLALAQAWGFPETADWIESTDTGTYARLILQGPEIVEDGADQPIESDLAKQDFELLGSAQVVETDAFDATIDTDVNRMAINHIRETMQDILSSLGKHAILTIADTYETQGMGVMVDPSRNSLVAAERLALIRSLGQTSSLWLQLEQAMSEVQRGIGSLQYLIDPENN